jgi:transcription elongation factor Elf1
MSWRLVMERFLDRRPACEVCGAPMECAGDEIVRTLPAVLETRYRCVRCGEEIVRCDVADLWQ